ncbi:MAG: MFS transporter [Deltaproteobacteria bacterium]|nr:MFS transporter [Deltaproteobacteria bacterium]
MNVTTAAATGSRSFHGWRIVAATAVAQALGIALLGGYQFLVTPIAAEFGATSTQMGLGMTIVILGTGLISPILGRPLDRGATRSLMLVGVATMLGSTLLLSRASALWQLAAAAGLFGVGTAMYGPLPVNVLLVNWFAERRGTALALAATGMSVTSLCLPPLAAWLIDSFGWRHAVAAIGLAAASIAAPTLARWVIARPEDIGQLPDGRPPERSPVPAAAAGDAASTTAHPAVADLPLAQLVRDRNFWLISFGFGLAFSVSVALGVYLVPHLENTGIERQSAALALMTLGVSGAVGKLAVGALADRVNRKALVLVLLAIYACAWLLIANWPSLEAAVVASVAIGIGGYGLTPLMPVFLGACFGRDRIGQVSGFVTPMGLPFLIAMAPAVGYVRDQTGSFALGFNGLAGVLVAAAALLALVRIPAREPGSPPAAEESS